MIGNVLPDIFGKYISQNFKLATSVAGIIPLSLVSVSLLLSHVSTVPGPQEDTASGSSSPTRHSPS